MSKFPSKKRNDRIFKRNDPKLYSQLLGAYFVGFKSSNITNILYR